MQSLADSSMQKEKLILGPWSVVKWAKGREETQIGILLMETH